MRRPPKSKIAGLERKPKHTDSYFDDLPIEQQRLAEHYLRKMLQKRRILKKPVKGWILPILVGQARRLAKNPPSSNWGRSMHAKRGGKAVQQKYRREGKDPTAKASMMRQYKQGKPIQHRSLYKQPDSYQPPYYQSSYVPSLPPLSQPSYEPCGEEYNSELESPSAPYIDPDWLEQAIREIEPADDDF